MQCSLPLHAHTRAGPGTSLPPHTPGSVPSPWGARRPPQGTYLALAFECAGRRGFHLGFQTSFRKEGGKKKKKSNYANGLRPGRRALDLMLLLYEFLEQPDRADLWGRVTATPGPAAGASRS